VFRKNRGTRVKERGESAAKRSKKVTDEDATKVQLDAEDLTRGMVIDAQRVGETTWRSLCLRDGTYHIGSHQFTHSDEGAVSVSAREQDGQLFLHENLFTWDGWSLVAPRPQIDKHAPANCAASPTGLNLKTEFSVPCGSLQPLRFGAEYRLRARAMDLAGDVLQLDSEDAKRCFRLAVPFGGQSDKIRYSRFEVPAAPTVHMQNEPDVKYKGRALESIVLKSPEKSAVFYIAPPPVALQTAIDHGLYDQCKPQESRDILSRISDRANDDDWAGDIKHGKFPFIPDPLVWGVRIEVLLDDGSVRAETLPFVHGGALKPVELILRKSDGDLLRVSTSGSSLTLELPVGYECRIAISSCLRDVNGDQPAYPSLGLWAWMPEAQRAPLADAIVGGRNPVFNPPRVIKIVHAASSPSVKPKLTLDKSKSQRAPGESRSPLSGVCEMHAHSTGQIAYEAEWTDIVDDPARSRRPELSPLASTVVAIQEIKHTTPNQAPLDRLVAQLPDTRYREMDLTPIATARHAQFFATANRQMKPGDTVKWPTLSSVPPPPPVVGFVLPTQKLAPDNASRRLREGYGLRVYLARPWFVSGKGEALAVAFPPSGTKLPDALKMTWATQWGLDPLWLQSGNFADMVLDVRNLIGKSATVSNQPLRTKDGIVHGDLAVLPIDLKHNFDEERGLWFCDLVFDIEGSVAPELYFPFVRLGLVRYQEHSINDDVKVSPVVTADVVQMLPRRALKVTPVGKTLTVTLEGPLPSSARTTHAATCVLEVHDARGEGVGWAPTGYFADLQLNADGVWEKTGWEVPSCSRARVLVKEYELLPDHTGNRNTRRLVYFDTYPL
jgi:hypothetical protein